MSQPDLELSSVTSTDQNLNKFIRGDYLIEIFVQYGKMFIYNDEKQIDMKLDISINDEHQYGKELKDVETSKNTLKPIQQKFFFELKDQTPDQINSAVINIKLLYSKSFFKNDYIGFNEELVPTIYFKPNHKMEHCWVGIANPDLNDGELSGILKISFQVTGPNDRADLLSTFEENPDQNTEIKIPNSVKRQSDQLRIMIFSLKDFDFTKNHKPYFECNFGSSGGRQRPLKTQLEGIQILPQYKSAVIMQSFLIPIMLPLTIKNLYIDIKSEYNEVKKEDEGIGFGNINEFFSKTEHFGRIKIDLSKIFMQLHPSRDTGRGTSKMKEIEQEAVVKKDRSKDESPYCKSPYAYWYHVYGADKSYDINDENCKQMNKDVKKASKQIGSVFLGFHMEKLEEGKLAEKKVALIKHVKTAKKGEKEFIDESSFKHLQVIAQDLYNYHIPDTKFQPTNLLKEISQKNDVYFAKCHIFQGINLPEPETAFRVRVKIGSSVWETKEPKEYPHNYNRWSCQLQQNLVVQTDPDQKGKNKKPEQQDQSLAKYCLDFNVPEKQELADMRVYFYLIKGEGSDSKEICYWSDNLQKYLNKDNCNYSDEKYKYSEDPPKYAQTQWVQLMSNKLEGGPESNLNAGMIGFRLEIRPRLAKFLNKKIDENERIAMNNHFENHTTIENQKNKKPSLENYNFWTRWHELPKKRMDAQKIRCFIFQCRDLPAADASNASDPFLEIWTPDKQEVRTQTVEQNCSPLFMKPLEFYYDFDDIQDAPPIVIDVFDEDINLIGKSKDFLGRAIINLRDKNSNYFDFKNEKQKINCKKPEPIQHDQNGTEEAKDKSIPEPNYHKFYFEPGSAPEGEVLCSFHIASANYEFTQALEYQRVAMENLVKRQNYEVSINISSLRDLESCSIMPVQRARVKMMITSLLSSIQRQAVHDILTQPGQAGPNPNFDVSFNFVIKMPIEEIYRQAIPCRVLEQMFLYPEPQLLGTFSIDTNKIIKKQMEKNKKQSEGYDNLQTLLSKYHSQKQQGQQEQEKQEDKLIKVQNVQDNKKAVQEKALADTFIANVRFPIYKMSKIFIDIFEEHKWNGLKTDTVETQSTIKTEESKSQIDQMEENQSQQVDHNSIEVDIQAPKQEVSQTKKDENVGVNHATNQNDASDEEMNLKDEKMIEKELKEQEKKILKKLDIPQDDQHKNISRFNKWLRFSYEVIDDFKDDQYVTVGYQNQDQIQEYQKLKVECQKKFDLIETNLGKQDKPNFGKLQFNALDFLISWKHELKKHYEYPLNEEDKKHKKEVLQKQEQTLITIVTGLFKHEFKSESEQEKDKKTEIDQIRAVFQELIKKLAQHKQKEAENTALQDVSKKLEELFKKSLMEIVWFALIPERQFQFILHQKLMTHKRIRINDELEHETIKDESEQDKENKKDEKDKEKRFGTNEFFETYDIQRGQSRGLKQQSKLSNWLFGEQQKDKSGSVSNISKVGLFKGRIKITKQKQQKAKPVEETKANKPQINMSLLHATHGRSFSQNQIYSAATMIKRNEQISKPANQQEQDDQEKFEDPDDSQKELEEKEKKVIEALYDAYQKLKIDVFNPTSTSDQNEQPNEGRRDQNQNRNELLNEPTSQDKIFQTQFEEIVMESPDLLKVLISLFRRYSETDITREAKILAQEAMLTQVEREYRSPQQVEVRLYILRAYDLVSKDLFGESDPYIKVLHGDQEVFNNRDKFKLDQKDPIFNDVITFTAEFPATLPITIECWDYDELWTDDLIGATKIPLVDRFYSPKWRLLTDTPIERRRLKHPSCQREQGILDMWLDMAPQPSKSKSKLSCQDPRIFQWKLNSEPESEIEIRFCALDLINFPQDDNLSGVSDVFIQAQIEDFQGNIQQMETDVHWRANKKASWNYRMIFKIPTPLAQQPSQEQKLKLVIKAMNQNFITSNDLICSWEFYIHDLLELVNVSQRDQILNEDLYKKLRKQITGQIDKNKKLHQEQLEEVKKEKAKLEELKKKYHDEMVGAKKSSHQNYLVMRKQEEKVKYLEQKEKVLKDKTDVNKLLRHYTLLYSKENLKNYKEKGTTFVQFEEQSIWPKGTQWIQKLFKKKDDESGANENGDAPGDNENVDQSEAKKIEDKSKAQKANDESKTDVQHKIYLHTVVEGKKKMPRLGIDLRFLTENSAEKRPVGIGQESQNIEPCLPPPEGRLSMYNPLNMLFGMCSKQLLLKVACYACLIFVVVLIIYAFPTFFSSLFAMAVDKAWTKATEK